MFASFLGDWLKNGIKMHGLFFRFTLCAGGEYGWYAVSVGRGEVTCGQHARPGFLLASEWREGGREEHVVMLCDLPSA